jgi:diguanylate cyclase (GGDEF)-like protein/putative nucleotidyltransferase with HDIG domain
MDIRKGLLELIVGIVPIISIIYVIVGIRLYKNKGKNNYSYFSLLMFAAALYSFGYFLELNSFSISTLLIIRNFEYLGTVFIPTFGILFIADLTRNEIKKRNVSILFIISLSLWILFVTNPIHGLVYKSIALRIVAGFGIAETVKGPLFYSMLIYYVVLILVSSILLIKAYKASERIGPKKGYGFLLISFQLPWFTVLFILFGWDVYIDPTPVTIMIVAGLLGINEIRHDVFQLSIKKWEETCATLDRPAILIDKNEEIRDMNLLAAEIVSNNNLIGKELILQLEHSFSTDEPISFKINNKLNWFDIKKNDFDTKRKLKSYFFSNVTESKNAADALKESERRLIAAQQMAHVGSWELNLATKEVWASEEAFNIYGIEYLSPILPLETVQKLVLQEYREKLDSALANLISNNDAYDLEFKIKMLSTSEIKYVHSIAKLVFDEKGKPSKVVGTIQDITEQKKKEEEVSYLSYHDQLTGLYNRRFYEEELGRLDTERNLPLTVIMGDVNGLKLVNDSFGHAVGDKLLVKVADIIKKSCRGDDIIARLGGDEFVIILPNTEGAEAEKMIQRMNKLASEEKIGGLDVSISFGYETKLKEDQNIQDILRNTEDHMYRHKLYEGAGMRSKTIELIMSTLYEKNNREMLHSKRVSQICEVIASNMNFDKDYVNQISIAGLMHDIGKIGIEEGILNKQSKLSDEEKREMQRHSEIGFRILNSVKEFSEIAEYVLEHQEKWDGTGYPRGLQGENISIQARIIAVADAFDAMTTYRTYGNILSEDQAVEEIKKCSGEQFDPEIVKVFVEKVLGKAS